MMFLPLQYANVHIQESFNYVRRIDNFRLFKGRVIFVVAGIFLIGVIAILLLNQGCAALEVGMPPFSGKFEHCARAAAAGDGARSALLNQGLSEDLASTTGKNVEKAVVDALDRGESSEEVARAATDAVFEVAKEASASSPRSSDGDTDSTLFGGDTDSTLFGGDTDSTLFGGDTDRVPPEGVPPEGGDTDSTLFGGDATSVVFAAAGAAAAAAAASSSVESAAPAATAAAEAAVRGEDGQAAERMAREAGLSDDVANVVGTAAEIGVREAFFYGDKTVPEDGGTAQDPSPSPQPPSPRGDIGVPEDGGVFDPGETTPSPTSPQPQPPSPRGDIGVPEDGGDGGNGGEGRPNIDIPNNEPKTELPSNERGGSQDDGPIL
jgi:hypothetical protein